MKHTVYVAFQIKNRFANQSEKKNTALEHEQRLIDKAEKPRPKKNPPFHPF